MQQRHDDDFFQDLRDAALHAFALGWPGYAHYCLELERDMRSRASSALTAFMAHLGAASSTERRSFVSWISLFSEERSGRDQLMPYPLKQQIVTPVLDEWVTDEPQNSEPHRWLGGREHLETALRLDPSDQIAIKRLIFTRMSGIAYATYQKPVGPLGSVTDDLRTLDEVEALLPRLSDSQLRSEWAQTIEEDRALILEYQRRSTGLRYE